MLILEKTHPTISVHDFFKKIFDPSSWHLKNVPKHMALVELARGMGVIKIGKNTPVRPSVIMPKPTRILRLPAVEWPLRVEYLESHIHRAFPQANEKLLLMRFQDRALIIDRKD